MFKPTMIAAAVCVACASALAAETNDSRAIDRLAFQGVRSFHADDIRKAITCDIEAVRAERSPADRVDLLRAIERTVRLGYLHAGFQSATVQAIHDQDTDRITAVVAEGPRHRCGGIKIAGSKNVPNQTLIDSLTTVAGKNGVLWQQGEPVRFDDLTAQKMRERVADSLAQQGFLSPVFDLQIVAPQEQELASLVVDIKDTGPRAQIGEIKVTGTKRDDQEVVVRHLELASGQPLDSRLPARIQQQLAETGRYLTSDIEIVRSTLPTQDGRESFDVTIRVREFEKAPSLSQQLSQEEQTVLRLADWARRWSAGELNEDLVITAAWEPKGAADWLDTLGLAAQPPGKGPVEKYTVRLVLSPREGTVMTIRANGADDRTIEE